MAIKTYLPRMSSPVKNSFVSVFNEKGNSVSNFTTDTGSWSSDGSIISITTSSSGRLRHNIPIYSNNFVIEVETMVSSSGIASGNHIAGLLFYWDGSGSGDPSFQLFGQTTTLSSGVVRAEHDSVAGIVSTSYALSVDTWYKLRIEVTGTHCHTYVNDIYLSSGLVISANSDSRYVGLIASGNANATYNFRNFNCSVMGKITDY